MPLSWLTVTRNVQYGSHSSMTIRKQWPTKPKVKRVHPHGYAGFRSWTTCSDPSWFGRRRLCESAPAGVRPFSVITVSLNPQAEGSVIIWSRASISRICPRRGWATAPSPLNAITSRVLPDPGQNRAHSAQVPRKTGNTSCRPANSLLNLHVIHIYGDT